MKIIFNLKSTQMKQTIKGFFFACIATVFLISCKKENNVTRTELNSKEVINEIKKSVSSSELAKGQSGILIDKKTVLLQEEILWDYTKFFNDNSIAITIVKTGEGESKKLTKFLVIQLDITGKPTDIYTYSFFQDKLSLNEMYELLSTTDLFSLKKIKPSYNGVIIIHGLKNNFFSAKKYTDGVVTFVNDKPKIKTSGIGIPPPPDAPLDEGCIYVTVDWYWQTIENGVVVDEEYLFSSQGIWCEGGGGGGSGGITSPPPTDMEMCEAAVDNILNSTTVASELVSNTIQSQTDLERTRLYDWKCLKHPTGWFAMAYDKGVMKRVATNKPWKFVSLENSGISMNGIIVTYGGTTTVTKIAEHATIGVQFAKMHLILQQCSTVSKNGAAVTRCKDQSAMRTYFVDTEGMQGY